MPKPRLDLGPVASTEDRIIGLLVERGTAHRAELARTLGLSRTRIGTVVAQLLGEGVLVETSAGEAVDGRAGPGLALSPGLGVVAGVQLATTHTDIIVETLAGTTLAQRHLDQPPPSLPADEHFSQATAMLDEMLAGSKRDQLRAVGVGAFGQIDPETGIVNTRPDETWWGVNLRQLGRNSFGVPTVAQNNSRLEAAAEATWGAGKGHDPMLYIHLGHGLNAIPVIGGEPVDGAHGGAGELGHTCININGPLCRCGGRGCLCLTASAAAIQRRVHETFGDDWDATIEAAYDGNRIALHAFLDAADALGIVVASLANMMDPAVIVLGGDMLRAGARFYDRLVTQFHDHVLTASGQAQITPAAFGGLGPGGARAAAMLARRHAVNSLRLQSAAAS